MSKNQKIKSTFRKHSVLLSMMLFFVFVFFVRTVYTHQNENGCIKCHTDEKKIKSLYKPPKIEIKQEEGEG